MNKSKADTNARGHLGTELTNKAETVLSVNPDETGDFSTIESEYTRGLPIETFAISIDVDGLPQLNDNFKKSDNRQTFKPANLPEQLHKNVLEKLNGKDYNYSGIWAALQSGFQDYGHSFGVNKSKDLLKHYIEHGYILKIDIDGTKQSKYKVNH
jgi:hypothetical protein